MTVCNMSIEGGARAGMIAPDDTTFAYLRGPPGRPGGTSPDAVERLADLRHRRRARSSTRRSTVDASALAPQVTWGTTPEHGGAGHRPRADRGRRRPTRRAGTPSAGRWPTWAWPAARPIEDIAVDVVFIGSCTNGRIEDLRAAAGVVGGRSVAPSVRAMVVPGSMPVKAPGRGRGPRRGLPRRRLRVARRRLLDVPGHEPGHPARRASAAPRPPTATSRAARARAAAPTW